MDNVEKYFNGIKNEMDKQLIEETKSIHVGFTGRLDTTYIVKIEKDGEYHVSEVGL